MRVVVTGGQRDLEKDLVEQVCGDHPSREDEVVPDEPHETRWYVSRRRGRLRNAVVGK